MRLNAEAIRPGSSLEWKGKLYIVLVNDTLERRLFLESDDNPGNTRTLGYEPGVMLECPSVPHVRSD